MSVFAAQNFAGVGPAVVVWSVEVARQEDVEAKSDAGFIAVEGDLVEDVVVLAESQQFWLLGQHEECRADCFGVLGDRGECLTVGVLYGVDVFPVE